MSCLENDRLKDRLVEEFDEWFERRSDKFYDIWSERDPCGEIAKFEEDREYFEDNINDLYQEIEDKFMSLDYPCFDIQELYESIYGEE